MILDSLNDSTIQMILLDSVDTNSIDSVNAMCTQLRSQPPDTSILGMPEGLARIVIPVFVTLFTFFLGHFIAWIKQKMERRAEIESYKNLVSKWVELMKKAVDTQIASCREFSSSLEAAVDMIPIRFSANKLLADKIDSISLEKFIDAFSTNATGDSDKNYRMTFNIVSQFNFLKHIEGRIENYFEEYQKRFDEMTKEWNSKFTDFDDVISNQSKEIGNNQNHADFLFHKQVLKTINDWIKNAPPDKRSLKHTEEALIKPLMKQTLDELKKSQSEYAFKLSRIMRDLSIDILQWENSKNENVALYRGIADKINYAYTKLVEAADYFKKDSKTVIVWKIK